MLHSMPVTLRLAVALMAALAAAPAMAQTVLPMAPQAADLARCGRLVTTHPAEAEAVARAVLAAPAVTADQRLSATACLGMAQAVSGQAQAAAATLDEAGPLLDAPGVSPIGRLEAQMRLAAVLARLDRSDEALEMQEQVLAGAREHGVVPIQIESLRFMAQVRSTQFDDPEGALPYFQQAYDLHRVLVKTTRTPHPPLSYDLAYTLFLLGRYPQADAMFAEAAAGAATFPELAGMSDRITSHRAEIARLNGDPAAAEPQLAAVAARQHSASDLVGEAATLQRLANARLDLGRAQEALAPATQALEAAERSHSTADIRESLQALARVHEALGQPAVAAGYAARARELARSEDRQRMARQLARMQAQAASSDLSAEAAAGQIDQARAALLRNIALGALVVLVPLVAVLLLRARRRQRRLEALGVTDPLTGLPDRRGASKRLDALHADSPRAAVLLIDVDHFKVVNDRFGHAGGERVLAQVARCLREACDAGDLVARWGGEEFLVLREDTSQEAAFALAAHLRAQVESLKVESAAGEPQQLSVSIGVAPLPLFPAGAGWQETVRAADRALYAARHSGRNAWVGLWGVAGGVDAGRALADMQAALAEGWFQVGGNRPTDWSGAWVATADVEAAPAPPDAVRR